MCTNARKERLGGVLMQKGHVICFESKKVKDYESNYITHDLESVVIVHALKMWRHYLIGRRFVYLHSIGFTVYPTITGQGIPRPNEGIHNQALPCIPPLPVKEFLGLVIFFLETTPLSFKTI